MLVATYSPGFKVKILLRELGLQSSELHTCTPPLVTSSAFAFGPTLRWQATEPVLVIVNVNFGARPGA